MATSSAPSPQERWPRKPFAFFDIHVERPALLGLWFGLAALVVLLVPSLVWLGRPLWALAPAERLQMWVWSAAFLVWALLLLGIAASSVRAKLIAVLAVTMGTWGAGAAALFLDPAVQRSRGVALVAVGVGVALGLVPFVRVSRSAVFVGGVAAAAALAFSARARIPEPATGVSLASLRSSLSQLSVAYHRGAAPTLQRGGAIAPLDSGMLLSSSEGRFYRLDWDSTTTQLRVTALDVASPLDPPDPLVDLPDVTYLLYRVTGLVVRPDTGAGPRIYVAHQRWHGADKCMTMRVSTAILRPDGTVTPWERVFETQPCVPFTQVYKHNETGGRLVWHQGKLLLSVGDHGMHGDRGDHAFAQDTTGDYGKVLLLDLNGGRTIVSRGHRNPQGLTVDDQGRIWSAEQGPRGGDEINIIRPGGNYGWPLTSYGTEYGLTNWPFNRTGRNHGAFTEPLYVFQLPSPAITNILQLHGDHFAEWRGDFLVGSLNGQSLMRVRTRDDHVLYVEQIPIGNRIRDLAQARDGRVVMWTDEGDVVILSRPSVRPRGEVAYDQCAECHGADLLGTSNGPRIRGLHSRRVASVEGYRYSAALQRVGGRWDEKRLDEFLRDPQAFAPGTMMSFRGIADPSERRALIEYLWANY